VDIRLVTVTTARMPTMSASESSVGMVGTDGQTVCAQCSTSL
jgi:hypothetical protein